MKKVMIIFTLILSILLINSIYADKVTFTGSDTFAGVNTPLSIGEGQNPTQTPLNLAEDIKGIYLLIGISLLIIILLIIVIRKIKNG